MTNPKIKDAVAAEIEEQFSSLDEGLREKIRFNYKSLTQRDGALYLSVDIMAGAEENLADGVKSDLLVSIPLGPKAELPYKPPYQLFELNLAGSQSAVVSIFDPLDFVKNNPKEAGLVAQADIYAAWQKEFEAGRLHTLLRMSIRLLNAFEAGRGFLNAIDKGKTVFLAHMVHTASESLYCNMNAITAPGNFARSLFKSGMLGKFPWCWEADHNRAEKDTPEQMDYVSRVLRAMSKSGVHSAIVLDVTSSINPEGKNPSQKYKKAIAYAREQLVILKEALEAQERSEPGSVLFALDKWYVELDLAVDGQKHNLGEIRYMTRAAKRLGKEFGCVVNVVPGIGGSHGFVAGDAQLSLLEKLLNRGIRPILGMNTGAAVHAGSAWNEEMLQKARESGTFCVNKSTEPGAILLAVLRDSEDLSDQALYKRITYTLFDAYKGKVSEDQKKSIEAALKDATDYKIPFDYDYDKEQGTWLPTNKRSEWLTGSVQREWPGLRYKDGQKKGALVFGNDLVWGISESAWDEYARLIELTISNYLSPRVMNGIGMQAALSEYTAARATGAPASEATAKVEKRIRNLEEQLASARKEITRIVEQLEIQKEIEVELEQRLTAERSQQDKLSRIQELSWRHITKGAPFSAPEELKSQLAEYLFDAPDVASEARNFLDALDKKGESEFVAQAGQIALGVFDRLYKASKFSEARKINGFLGANVIYVDGEDDAAFAYAVFIARVSQQARLPFLLIAKDETTRQALAALIPGIAERNLRVMPSDAMTVTFIGDAIRDFQKESIAKVNFYLGRLVDRDITESFKATYPNVSFNTALSPANAENLQTILSYNGITIPGISDTEFNLWQNARATLRRCA